VTDGNLSNAAAARLLGVSGATLKRWANSGVLPSDRTLGGHRRFTLAAVLALRARLAGRTTVAPPPAEVALLGACLAQPTAQGLAGHLLALRAQLGHWPAVVARAERAFEEALHRRAAGLLTGLEERLCTQKLARAVAILVEMFPSPPDARGVLLLAAEGERHTLPLSLAELVFRDAGHPTLFAGAHTPLPSVTRALRTLRPACVVVLATSGHPKPVSLPDQAALLVNATRLHGIPLVLLGGGAWPARPDVLRVRAAADVVPPALGASVRGVVAPARA